MVSPRTAVLFRTHFWDDFCRRQFDRLQSIAENTDLFVLVDETSGHVGGIEHSRIFSVTEAGLLGMGLAQAGEGNLLWFNGDYPLYKFIEQQPNYEFYVQLEYDVIVNQPIINLVSQMSFRGIDFVGLTKGEKVPDWFWIRTMTEAYDLRDVRHQLICFSVFSRAALLHLWQARLRQSEAFQRGLLTEWPFCEGFIPTELALAGFSACELSEFGNTNAYDHWPPYLEADAARLGREDFLHPVLDEPRYIASMQKYHIGLAGYLNPNSQFHQKMRRLPPRIYARALASSFACKAKRNLGRAAASLASGRLAHFEKG